MTILLSKQRRIYGPKRTKIIVTNLRGVSAGDILSHYARRWGVEIVFTQMTKERMFSFGAGRDHIPNFYLAIIDDDTVNQQFHQLPALGEGKFFKRRCDALAEGAEALCQRRNVDLFLCLPIQLA